jgi:hypothetical protein
VYRGVTLIVLRRSQAKKADNCALERRHPYGGGLTAFQVPIDNFDIHVIHRSAMNFFEEMVLPQSEYSLVVSSDVWSDKNIASPKFFAKRFEIRPIDEQTA